MYMYIGHIVYVYVYIHPVLEAGADIETCTEVHAYCVYVYMWACISIEMDHMHV